MSVHVKARAHKGGGGDLRGGVAHRTIGIGGNAVVSYGRNTPQNPAANTLLGFHSNTREPHPAGYFLSALSLMTTRLIVR